MSALWAKCKSKNCFLGFGKQKARVYTKIRGYQTISSRSTTQEIRPQTAISINENTTKAAQYQPCNDTLCLKRFIGHFFMLISFVFSSINCLLVKPRSTQLSDNKPCLLQYSTFKNNKPNSTVIPHMFLFCVANPLTMRKFFLPSKRPPESLLKKKKIFLLFNFNQ